MSDPSLKTEAEITWCKGCGNFGIFTAVRNAIEQLDIKHKSRQNFVITAGIGCHAKIFDYLNISGVYSLHGRDTATAQGIKIANPELKVITFSGDGNGLGEGLAHTLFAAKRNQDITMILHNNSVYALTTGQFSPLTEMGWEGPSTPGGSIEGPFNAISLLIEAGATFVARCFAGKIDHLTETIKKAVEHEGFSFIEVLQPAVPYHRWSEYNEKVDFLEIEPESREKALKTAREVSRYTLGIFFQESKQVYHKALYGDHNPTTKRLSKNERLKKISQILEP